LRDLDEIRLMHPNDMAQTAGYLWVHTLVSAITRPNDDPATFASIFKSTRQFDKDNLMGNWFEIAQNADRMPAKVNIGWAKIAWTYGMH
jgi:lipocalin